MASNRLNELLEAAGHPPLTPQLSDNFIAYLALLLKWNAKTNLTAIRDEEGILSRHFVESILCATALPNNIVNLLDFGSGAGFPGIPIALIRPEIHVTLAESQNKKAAFLREAARVLQINTNVHSARAEELKSQFDCVTLRAVDNMAQAIPAAVHLLKPGGHLAVLTTHEDSGPIQSAAQSASQAQTQTQAQILTQDKTTNSSLQTHEFTWSSQSLSSGTNRILLTGKKG